MATPGTSSCPFFNSCAWDGGCFWWAPLAIQKTIKKEAVHPQRTCHAAVSHFRPFAGSLEAETPFGTAQVIARLRLITGLLALSPFLVPGCVLPLALLVALAVCLACVWRLSFVLCVARPCSSLCLSVVARSLVACPLKLWTGGRQCNRDIALQVHTKIVGRA